MPRLSFNKNIDIDQFVLIQISYRSFWAILTPNMCVCIFVYRFLLLLLMNCLYFNGDFLGENMSNNICPSFWYQIDSVGENDIYLLNLRDLNWYRIYEAKIRSSRESTVQRTQHHNIYKPKLVKEWARITISKQTEDDKCDKRQTYYKEVN